MNRRRLIVVAAVAVIAVLATGAWALGRHPTTSSHDTQAQGHAPERTSTAGEPSATETASESTARHRPADVTLPNADTSPLNAFARLSELRAQALTEGDSNLLSQLTVAQSPARKAESQTDLSGFRGWEVRIDLTDAQVISHSAGAARLSGETHISASRGTAQRSYPAQEVVIDLRVEAGTWKVYEVREADTGS